MPVPQASMNGAVILILEDICTHEFDACNAQSLCSTRDRVPHCQNSAPVAAQHEGDAADVDRPDAVLALAHNNLFAARVLHIDRDGCGVRHVAQAALLRRDAAGDVVLLHLRLPHKDVCVPAQGEASSEWTLSS